MSINESKIAIMVFFDKYSSTIKDLIQSISLCSSFDICLYLLDNELSSDISDEILEMMGELTIEEKKDNIVFTKGRYKNLEIILTKVCEFDRETVLNYFTYEYMTFYDIVGVFNKNVVFYPHIIDSVSSILKKDSFITGCCYSNCDVLTKNGYRYSDYKKSFSCDKENSNSYNFFISKLAIETTKPKNIFTKNKNPTLIIGENFLCQRINEKLYMVKE